MSRSTIRNQLLVQDGAGNDQFLSPSGTRTPLYLQGIQTGVFITKAVNIEEHRRLSITLGVGSATGAAADVGGFTGTLLVLGTDELGQCNGGTGTQENGLTNRPGVNGFTGGRFWNVIPSGSVAITNATQSILLSFTDVGVAYIRVAFNAFANGQPTAIASGTLGGSGTMYLYLTAKNT